LRAGQVTPPERVDLADFSEADQKLNKDRTGGRYTYRA